jgi:hypothetical protein
MGEAKDPKEPARTEHGHLIAESVSAYQKYLRRSDFENALYFALLVYRRAPSYIWRRTLIAAAEDVGLADVEAVMRVGQLFAMLEGRQRRQLVDEPPPPDVGGLDPGKGSEGHDDRGRADVDAGVDQGRGDPADSGVREGCAHQGGQGGRRYVGRVVPRPD